MVTRPRNGVRSGSVQKADVASGGHMHSTAFRAPWTIRTLAVLGASGVFVGCSEPLTPVPPVPPTPIIIIGGHPIVFNAQLRVVGNPNETPLIAVVGHVQLKLYQTEDGFVVGMRAELANTECESALPLGGGMYFIQDSEDFPSPLIPPLMAFPLPEDPSGCGVTVFDGATGISADLASRLIGNPDEFTAVFFLNDGSAIAGQLQVAGADLTPTR
jgi:hypothetical protein